MDTLAPLCEQPSTPLPKRGWEATLKLSFEAGPTRPFVTRTHTGPLRIQRPFYPEPKVCHVYLLHPPAGVVGGDNLHLMAQVNQEGVAGLVTTPGATQFYRSNGTTAQFKQDINIDAGSLEWLPQENIFFDHAIADLHTNIHLSQNASFLFWDIQCYGRPASKETFTHGRVHSTTHVYLDNMPLFFERFKLDEHNSLHQLTGMRGATVNGLMLAYKGCTEQLDKLRSMLPDPAFSVTCVDSLLVIRYRGDTLEHAKNGFIAVWSQLRKHTVGHQACQPRIWST